MAQFVSQRTSGSLKLPVINSSRLGGLYLLFFSIVRWPGKTQSEGVSPHPWLAGLLAKESPLWLPPDRPSSFLPCAASAPALPLFNPQGSAELQASFKTHQVQKVSVSPSPTPQSESVFLLPAMCFIWTSVGENLPTNSRGLLGTAEA